jgi:RHH-type proline utilization regulon transcriptional repressor/proline dehydrogenase/delta 1-pyrroline-5-carboxylate dehydrogenase
MVTVTSQPETQLATELARQLLLDAGRPTRPERALSKDISRLLDSPAGLDVILTLTDRVLRRQAGARALIELAESLGPLSASGLGAFDYLLLQAARQLAPLAPHLVVSLARWRLQAKTRGVIWSAKPDRLASVLARPPVPNARINLNLLGESVLGHREASRRLAGVLELLRRADVDCVSVKASAIAAWLSQLDRDGSAAAVAVGLKALYQAAMAQGGHKLVNLDMEEHAELYIAIDAFQQASSDPACRHLVTGIALQAYLPDSHGALDDLLAFSRRRVDGGGAPVRVRLVKGANMAMEAVNAELRGWPSPIYPSKAETDASYLALLEKLIKASATGEVMVGVASHNIFDLAMAMVWAGRCGVGIDLEMLAGMADPMARAVARRHGSLLLYAPICDDDNFDSALGYLARRLDENASREGFLRHLPGLSPQSQAWSDQVTAFVAAAATAPTVNTIPYQTQNRLLEPAPRTMPPGEFSNEPDTDLTVEANREFALSCLRTAPNQSQGEHVRPVGREVMAEAMALARSAVVGGRTWSTDERRDQLESVADCLRENRGRAISAMVAEVAKTFEEADAEVSEAVDYARYYASQIGVLAALEGELDSQPLGVVLVASPWNFPFAIAAGGCLAALAAGNAVLFKPSPRAISVGGVLADLLHRGGLRSPELQFLPVEDSPDGTELVSSEQIDAVILTGSYDTARRFAAWRPERTILAETSGKNAIVVAESADIDQAVEHLVRSAFGYSGQKCSAASLGIVHRKIHDDPLFMAQLADATESLPVGPATDPAAFVTPISGPMTDRLVRALTVLDPGEHWLVEPRCLDQATNLWSPGVRLGVRPGSFSHLSEWFGPVLAIMRCDNLPQAVAWQRQVEFGLTGGLESLDRNEMEYWAANAACGNLYINRVTTGAMVGRQPFGGYRRSHLGPTTKTGGPNYLIGLRTWRDAEPTSLEDAFESYRRSFVSYFSRVHELAGLRAEANVLRYRPVEAGVLARSNLDTDDVDLAKAASAALITGTKVSFSLPEPRSGLVSALDAILGPGRAEVVVESAESLANRMPGLGRNHVRLRLLGRPEPAVVQAASHHGVDTYARPICSTGRVELLNWLVEQSVSWSRHRYGHPVRDSLCLGAK